MNEEQHAPDSMCTLRELGHLSDHPVRERSGQTLEWVTGSIETLDENDVLLPRNERPIHFVPDLSGPHTTKDPAGLSILLFHHAESTIRLLAARGLPILWLPNRLLLVVGYRNFRMSLEPITACAQVASSNDERGPHSREEVKRAVDEMMVGLYRDMFDRWMSDGRSLPDSAHPLHLLAALERAWSRPQFEMTFDHLDFREALLDSFRRSTPARSFNDDEPL